VDAEGRRASPLLFVGLPVRVRFWDVKSSQVKSSQVKSSQVKSSQVRGRLRALNEGETVSLDESQQGTIKASISKQEFRAGRARPWFPVWGDAKCLFLCLLACVGAGQVSSSQRVVARAAGGPERTQGAHGAALVRVRGGLLSSLGGVVIRIRILMYRDVSCVYPEGYMYP
jgi:hypothetical protein